MRPGRLTLAPALLLLALSQGCSSPEEISAHEQRGQMLYLRNCTACHGPDAGGLALLGNSLRSNPFIEARSTRELVDFLKVGRRAGDPANTSGLDMPPKGANPNLTESDLLALAAYLKSLPPENPR